MSSVIQQKFRLFLTDVVTRWNAGQKMTFFMLLMAFEVSMYILWMLFVRHSSYAQLHVNIDIINQMFPWAFVILFMQFVLAYVFYRFQDKSKLIKQLQLVIMVIYSGVAAYVGYLVGEDNIMSAIALSTAGVLIVLLCERSYAFMIVMLNVFLMFAVMYASKTGIFPPSNFYVGTTDSVFWVYTYLHLCASKVLIILLLTDNMLSVLESSYNQTKFMSEHDQLTGLPNRAFIQEVLKNSLETCEDVSLVMIDLDHFKQINDNFGHIVGDEVLQHFGKLLKHTKRATDEVARYGGEEFVMVLPNTSMSEAYHVSKQVHGRLNALRVYVDENQALYPKGCFGVVSFKFIKDQYDVKPHRMFQKLFEVADAAMYYAKNNGRNQVICADMLDEKTTHDLLLTRTDLDVIRF